MFPSHLDSFPSPLGSQSRYFASPAYRNQLLTCLQPTFDKMSNALSSVARIAYLASDVIVDSQPTLPSTSQFAKKYDSLSATSTRRPTIFPVPLGGDPGSTLLRNGSGATLVSYTSSATAQTAIRLVLCASELSSLPLVLHLAVKDDLSDVSLLRSALPFFLVSTTAQKAHDNSLLASRLARTEKKAVVHVFYEGKNDSVEEIAESEVLPFLLSDKLAAANGHNGHANGENGVNGHSTAVVSPVSELFKLYEHAALSTVARIRRACPPFSVHGTNEPHTVIFALGDIPSLDVGGVSVVSLSLLTPLPPSRILDAIPPSASRVIILEQVHRWNTKWTPLYLELVNAIQQQVGEQRPHIQSVYFGQPAQVTPSAIMKLFQVASSSTPLQLGGSIDSPSASLEVPHIPKHESSYTKILSHVFGERLEVSNSPALVPKQGAIATSPEFALGRIRGQLDLRNDLIRSVQQLMELTEVSPELHKLLSQWILVKDDAIKSRSVGKELVAALESSKLSSPLVDRIIALRIHFPSRSRWIIGSDAWSYDLGASGLHHAIASGLDINILIIDTLPYTSRNSADPHRRKQDAGLYAMNHGDAYVASVAVYSSYSQVLQSVMEADRHKGPSVVLAYLPYQNEEAPALEVLKETKLAVDAGYWPLYRWDPVKEAQGKEPFVLDSDAVKNDLQQFLDRQNHLSQLVRSKPELATELVGSLGENLKEARRRKAQQAYDDLVVSLDAPPLTVLYASDGGTAEKFAKRLANRAKARGLSISIGTLDSLSIEGLAQEEYVAFVTSVAGQGEPPQNGRTLFKALNGAALRGEKPFSKLRYSVFGLGDSHYWPRPEDAHYYNKPGKDLDGRLEQLGGERFAVLGLGDDQDADGPDTGYKVWESLVWKTFGVDSIEVKEAEPDPITNEHIKAASGYLRGTIAEGLQDTSTGALDPSDTQLTKFHGIYQQDDRDIRDERQAQGVEPAYSFMIRVRTPGGVCTPQQWLQMNQIADEHGNGTFKITTRATFQFHGVIKQHLKPSIQEINKALLDTLAACGDVNR
jgi:sulfite reductase (NADPH) hemoprotein beta-component